MRVPKSCVTSGDLTSLSPSFLREHRNSNGDYARLLRGRHECEPLVWHGRLLEQTAPFSVPSTLLPHLHFNTYKQSKTSPFHSSKSPRVTPLTRNRCHWQSGGAWQDGTPYHSWVALKQGGRGCDCLPGLSHKVLLGSLLTLSK